MTAVAELDTVTLSSLMREGSRAEHTEAESSNFMSSLLKGEVNEAGYTYYLAMLRPVYEALESVARELADDPIASVLIDPALDRLVALDADLAFWAPDGVPDVTSPAVDAYVARIRESAAWGGSFVAHHYTRYLGDLSGGQAIGKILGRAFGLEGQGLDFYAFEDIEKIKLYKDSYRDRLDGLDLTDEEKARVVEEVKVVFGLNSAIFTELTADLDTYRR
jgi:heme oxygenase